MGHGITQALGAAGIEVALCGRTAEAALAGRERLAASLRRQVARGRVEAEREAAILLSREGLGSDAGWTRLRVCDRVRS